MEAKNLLEKFRKNTLFKSKLSHCFMGGKHIVQCSWKVDNLKNSSLITFEEYIAYKRKKKNV